MREIFRQAEEKPVELRRVFYTITPEDIGARTIRTTECIINVHDVIGYVQRRDVGKRLIRTMNDSGDAWFWQAESDEQRDKRLAASPSS